MLDFFFIVVLQSKKNPSTPRVVPPINPMRFVVRSFFGSLFTTLVPTCDLVFKWENQISAYSIQNNNNTNNNLE